MADVPEATRTVVNRADEALKALDCAALHKMFVEREADVETIIQGIGTMIPYSKLGPRPQSDVGIQAMRDVALAAIQLARDFVTLPVPEYGELTSLAKIDPEGKMTAANLL